MNLSPEEIKQNIELLRNRVGDARTGGKGSQRRKVKVVVKPTVNNNSNNREAMIRLSKTSSKRWAPNN